MGGIPEAPPPTTSHKGTIGLGVLCGFSFQFRGPLLMGMCRPSPLPGVCLKALSSSPAPPQLPFPNPTVPPCACHLMICMEDSIPAVAPPPLKVCLLLPPKP